MLKVALTGGIACGKSAVADLFAARGAHVIKADEIGHRLMRPGQAVYEEIVRRFGEDNDNDILRADGSIDRAKLAAIAFAPGQSRIEELNRIIHPAVLAEQDRWMDELRQRQPEAVAVVEAALMLEAGARSHFDYTVVVVCRPEQKIERLAKRLEIDLASARAEVERRSAAQWPDAEKVRHADFIIDNSGPLEQTEEQVARLMSQFAREASRTA